MENNAACKSPTKTQSNECQTLHIDHFSQGLLSFGRNQIVDENNRNRVLLSLLKCAPSWYCNRCSAPNFDIPLGSVTEEEKCTSLICHCSCYKTFSSPCSTIQRNTHRPRKRTRGRGTPKDIVSHDRAPRAKAIGNLLLQSTNFKYTLQDSNQIC